jgi:integrase
MPQDNKPRRDPNKVKLTDPFIKNLKPQAQPFLVWDKKQRGLAVRVQPSGHLSFKCIYSRHARPRWYSLGPVDIGIVKARKEAAKVLVLVDDGKDPAADRKAQRGADTFEELATSYVDQYAKNENKSWDQADALVKKHLIPKWGKLKAADISRSDVKAMMKKIDALIVANQVLASASAIFTWAIKEELAGIKLNPCVKVDRNKTKSRERVLSDTEIPKFWTAFENDVGLVEGLALKMILLTGQRPGEVCHMRTEHIEGEWWTLPGEPVAGLKWPGTKNAQSHRVFLPKAAQQIVRNMDRTGLVFAGGRGAAITNLDAAMRTICKKLDVARATPHDLRRTHGSTITGLRFSRDAMNRIQNHKEGGIADVYDQHKYADENKEIMEAVANRFISLIDGGGADNVLHPSFGKAV